MQSVLLSLYAGLPVFLSHFSVTILVFIAAIGIYTLITPHKEFALIKKGNIAAAISFGGALLGLAIPLAFCLAGSVNIYDIIIWGAFILLIQLATYFVIDKIVGGVSKNIEKENVAPILFLVTARISVAIINAAAISG